MTAWLIGLLLVAIFLRSAAMWRTWAALLGASLLGKVFPYVEAWVLIDLVAAAIVIFPPRIGFQKGIAGAFAVMMLFELGWLWSAHMNVHVVVNAGILLGWVQLALLFTWGLHEHGAIDYLRNRVRRSVLVDAGNS